MTSYIQKAMEEEERRRKLLAVDYPAILAARYGNFSQPAIQQAIAEADSLHRLQAQGGLHSEIMRHIHSIADRDREMLRIIDAAGAFHPSALFSVDAARMASFQPSSLYQNLYAGEVARIADAARGANPLLADALKRLEEQETIHRKMMGMERAWVSVADPGRSILAFAEMQGIAAALRQGAPYGDVTASITRAVLGDWRAIELPDALAFADSQFAANFYVQHGFNAELADFTVPAYEESMSSAGFRPFVDLADDVDELELNLRRNNQAHNVIQRVEYYVRRFIEAKMREHFGERWYKQKAPAQVKANISNRRAKEHPDAIKDVPLLDFADFGDLWLIMEPRDHWPIFEPCFPDKEDARITFRRLLNERNPVSHTRFIGNLKCTLVRVEGSRVLVAIGVKDDLIIS